MASSHHIVESLAQIIEQYEKTRKLPNRKPLTDVMEIESSRPVRRYDDDIARDSLVCQFFCY